MSLTESIHLIEARQMMAKFRLKARFVEDLRLVVDAIDEKEARYKASLQWREAGFYAVDIWFVQEVLPENRSDD